MASRRPTATRRRPPAKRRPSPTLTLPEVVSEKQWAAHVVQLARRRGWAVFYVHDSRGSPAGWPDVIACRPPRFVVSELKTERGRLRPEQSMWLALLRACDGIEVFVWRPSDIRAVEEVLA